MFSRQKEPVRFGRTSSGARQSQIVFVHGLGGNPERTWTTFEALIAKDVDFTNYDIAAYRYPTTRIRLPFGKTMVSIRYLADGLASQMEVLDRQISNRVFIAHSLGGVIVRYYLLERVKKHMDLGAQKLVLIAAPNDGASLASVGSALSWKHGHLKQLCKHSEFLLQLNEDWERFSMEQRLDVLYITGGIDQIVRPESSCPFYGRDNVRTLIEHNHYTIITPSSANDIRYQAVKVFAIAENTNEVAPTRGLLSGDPLFDIYREVDKMYYFRRILDKTLMEVSRSRNVWLYGGSGYGKTTALREVAYAAGWKLFHISLSSWIIDTPNKFLRSIVSSLLEQLEREPSPSSSGDPVSLLIRTFKVLPKDRVNAILIEEIPLPTGALHSACMTALLGLLLRIESDEQISRSIRLLVSSINDPREDFDPKMHEKMQAMHLEGWKSDDILRLTRMLAPTCPPALSTEEMQILAARANGSPRFVKSVLRKRRAAISSIPPTLSDLVAQTQSELSQ